MDGSAQALDLKQASYWKAAWFSFLAPISCGLIILIVSSFNDRLAPDVQIWVDRFILVGSFFVQIISVIMGGFGMFAKGIPMKVLAVLGIVLSLIIGSFTFFLSILTIWGFGRGC